MAEPFRITPSLGPDLTQTGEDYYWDTIAPNVTEPSYQLGSVVVGNDGYHYIHVIADDDFAADAAVDVDMDTFEATAGGDFVAPVAVAAGDAFHARMPAPAPAA